MSAATATPTPPAAGLADERLSLLHHRLAMVMALAGLLAYGGGAGSDFLGGLATALFVIVAFFWRPDADVAARLERVWLPLAILLVARALFHALVLRDDLVLPVVDLLLLLLVAESFRPAQSQNDARLYALTFALLLAATAYRPGLLYAVGFSLYVIVMVPTFMVGHLKRSAASRGVRPPRVGRSFLVRTGLISLTVLTSAVAIFAVFPRASRAWTGRLPGPVASVAGFRDQVALGAHGATIQANPAVVLRVEFPDGVPSGGLYWRGRSYDRFDGRIWSRSRSLPPSAPPSSWTESGWSGDPVRQLIYAAPLQTRVLFALYPLIRVRPESTMQAIFDNAGDYYYWGGGPLVYRATSGRTRPSPERLRAAEGSFYPPADRFLQLPDLDPRIAAVADSLTRGADNTHDKATRLVDWFHGSFDYTLRLPDTPEEATVEHFLFERRAGHCEYFSTALAVMLRSIGVHAREVNGFLGGSWNEYGNYLAVTQNEAHSWVEAWIPGYGWMLFDPTPPSTGEGTSSAVWDWPGRFLVDALRHRWNKWVLDYDAGVQLALLDEMRSSAEAGDGPSPASGGAGLPRWLMMAVLLGAVLAAAMMARHLRRRQPALRKESRMYERLRSRYQRAGVVPTGSTPTPAGFARAVEEAGHAGAGALREFVDLYVRVRFGTGEPGAQEYRRLADAERRARAAIGTQGR